MREMDARDGRGAKTAMCGYTDEGRPAGAS